MTQPGIRVLFHETHDGALRSIAPVTKRDRDAFTTLLASFNLPPARLSENGRLVCDKAVAEKLAQAGSALNIRAPTKPVC